MVVPMSTAHNGIVVRLFFEAVDAVPSVFPAAFPITVLEALEVVWSMSLLNLWRLNQLNSKLSRRRCAKMRDSLYQPNNFEYRIDSSALGRWGPPTRHGSLRRHGSGRPTMT